MSQITLENGTTYRGRAIIFYPSLVVTKSRVKEELEKQGFANVTVWLDADDLPNDWPSSKKEDTSSWGNTQAWLEASWSRPTGQYPSSGSTFSILDYWIQKRAPQAVPPQPTCFQNNAQCTVNSDCCSGFCANNLCGVLSIPIQPTCSDNDVQCTGDSDCCSGLCSNNKCSSKTAITQATCAAKGESCESIDCCKGTLCEQDADGMYCKDESATLVQPPKEMSSLGYAAACAFMSAIATTIGICLISNNDKTRRIR